MDSQWSDSAQANQVPEDLQRLESALHDQHAILTRVVSELTSLHQAFCEQTHTDLSMLLEDNERLRQAGAASHEGDTVVDTGPTELQQEMEQMRAENKRLQSLLEEKEVALAEAQAKNDAHIEIDDTESYEAELRRDRIQLDADRQKLEGELQQLRVRNQELDDATREMEMEFSRERAELARERIRLERQREEVRAELERFQRDAPVRESLMSVQRLREKLTQHKA